ncbi:glycerol-3-phosphate dehydrogenase/oxidase [Niveispirillum sp. KHB5.9]|uniref:glycerol-3-phosphate dehydrogenase/oxidase n=1 Tax=Niveispirillum sp. KHB5.9 TaxID=3400269 RepID=UPI003A897148
MGMGASLNAGERAASFARLEAETFDLAIIGGGITGAGIARDAALRGLSVALVEAADYASGTSSRSSKMIHGGLRYLAQGDVALVRESASERQVLRRIAPHLARLTPFVIPTTSLATQAKLRAALWSFEKLGGVPAAEQHEVWGLDELARREPHLRRDRLNGAVAYPEFLTDDARLTLANIRSAAAAGAVVLNHARVEQLLEEGGRAVGLVARSSLLGEDRAARVRAKVIVNAAGPWVDGIRALAAGDGGRRLAISKGIHLVLPRALLPVSSTLILRAPDKRNIFAVPRGGFTYLGTTDHFHPTVDYWPEIGAADIDYLLRATEAAMDVAPIRDQDIVALWAGIRPLIGEAGKKATEVSRKDEMWVGPSGVIAIAGGKLSAYRAMAARIVDDVAVRLERRLQPCLTADLPLPGGERVLDGDDRLDRLYGTEAMLVRAGGDDVAAEARHGVLHEGAATLEDYWVRRSARAWFDKEAGRAALAPAADAMGRLLGWDERRRAAEIHHCLQLDRNSRRALLPDAGGK